jgi:predicted O-linked N-acetylglucosamine transferase (SPINDLY family)
MIHLIADSADDYCRKALRLAGEADYREAIQDQLRQRGIELFADLRPVEEHRRFFLDAIEGQDA